MREHADKPIILRHGEGAKQLRQPRLSRTGYADAVRGDGGRRC